MKENPSIFFQVLYFIRLQHKFETTEKCRLQRDERNPRILDWCSFKSCLPVSSTTSSLAAQGLGSPLFETIFFPLIKEIRLGRPEVDNLGAAVPVLLLHGALLAVVRVRDPRPAADHTPTLDICLFQY